MMRLRSKDIARAKSRRYLNPELEGRWRDEDMLALYFGKLRAMGYRFVQKRGPKSWKWKRFTTTMRRTIYLGVNWSQLSKRSQAALLAHEYVHALQWRGERGFGARYVFDERFRWAMETQAYRESVRAFRAMGMSEQAIHEYAQRLPNDFVRGYAITGRRLRADIRDTMSDVIVTP